MFGLTRTIKCAAAVFAAAAMLMVATLPSQADSGSVRLQITRAGFIVGVGGGNGTLNFRGKTYPLSVGGVSVGMIGASSADLVGRARNCAGPAISQALIPRWVPASPSPAVPRLRVCEIRMASCSKYAAARSDFRRPSTSVDCRYRCGRAAALGATGTGIHWQRYIFDAATTRLASNPVSFASPRLHEMTNA